MYKTNHKVSNFLSVLSLLLIIIPCLIQMAVIFLFNTKKIELSVPVFFAFLFLCLIAMIFIPKPIMKFWREAFVYELELGLKKEIESKVQKILAEIKRIADYPDKNLEIFIDLADNGLISLEGFPVPLKRGNFNVTPEEIRSYLAEEKRKCEEAISKAPKPVKPKHYDFWEKLLRVKTT